MALQNRCNILEKENEGLVKEMAENKRKTNDDKLLEEEEILVNLKRSGFKRQTPQVQPEVKLGKEEYERRNLAGFCTMKEQRKHLMKME